MYLYSLRKLLNTMLIMEKKYTNHKRNLDSLCYENIIGKNHILLKSYSWILLILLFLTTSSTVQAQLPTSFQQVDLLTGLTNATTMQFAPDGRIFILDRGGEIIIYKTDTQTSVSAGTLPVYNEFEDGLLGIAFDPNFLINNYIYLHYSVIGVDKNRVSRFTMNGDAIDLSSEAILLDWTTQRILSFHTGGDMAFDSQGNLYIATGDNTNHGGYSKMSQTENENSAEKSSSNTNDLRGKILRITPLSNGTYSIPPGNLFPVGTANTRPEIYVMGARNPYRIFVDDSNSDWLFWGEVGPDANSASATLGPEGLDELNLVKQAGNYGWPYFSGADNDAYQVLYRTPSPYFYDPASPENISNFNTGLTNLPAAQPAWLEFPAECYLAGPRYYHNASLTDLQRFPIELDEHFFYYDFNTSQIWAVEMDAQGNILNNEQFAPTVFPSNNDGFIDMEMGPDGKMYILSYGAGCCPDNVATGKLLRVDYTGITSNAPPTVKLSADVTSGQLPLTVNFSSVGTSDPNGDSPLTYEWDFDGDGFVDSVGANPTYTYTVAGTFNVQLKVNDGNGGVGVNNITIYAGNTAAVFTYNNPQDGGFMDWGDEISIDLTVTDAEDGSTGSGIDCNDVNIVPALGHLNHYHDLATITGCPNDFTLSYDGHDISGDMDIYYVINANYTDQGGLLTYNQIVLHPKRKEAEYYDTEDGTTIITNTDIFEGGASALEVNNNGYISFSDRNLVNMSAVKYKVASTTAGGTIEFRLGSPTGTLLATTAVPNTGSLNNWEAVESNFPTTVGKQDLYFVFKSSSGSQGIFDLNYVEFIGPGVSTDNTAPEISIVEALSSTEVQVKFSEYVTANTANQISNYNIDNGVTISSAVLQQDGLNVLLTVSPLSSSSSYSVTVSNVQNIAGLPIQTGSYPFSIINSMRINSGGDEVVNDAKVFTMDDYATGGSNYSRSIAIANTDNDAIYQTERYGDFTYEIPVPLSGEYDIRLHFAELYFGIGSTPGGEGSRVFNVLIEGNPVLTNFDILSEVDPATALQKELNDISITDGFATIELESITQNAKIAAIEILPKDTFLSTPNILITSPENGWNVNQSFDVAFRVENWTILEGDTHIHYYVDGVLSGPYYSHEPITFDNLSIGSHTIRVELFYANHTPTGIFDEVMVAVTDQQVCNETDFPDSWVVHEYDANPYVVIYTFANYDLDGDGLKDIVTGGWWYKNTGVVSDNWPKSTIGVNFGNVAHVHDFDNDGDMDLLGTTLGPSGSEYESVQLIWAENDGSGNFTIHTNLPTITTSWSEPFLAGLAGGDFGTGGLYQMAINWNGAENTNEPVQLLTPTANPTTGTWTIADISNSSTGEDLQAADIDNDGDLDLFQGVNWLENNGSGVFTTHLTGLSYGSTPDRAQLADFDNDGDLDAVVGQLGYGSNPDRYDLSWFEAPADPTQTWTEHLLSDDIHGSLSVFASDIDFDGDKDIIVGEWLGSRRLIAFENNLCSSDDWEMLVIDDSPQNWEHHDGARVVDIDNDGDLDIVSNGFKSQKVVRIYENTTPLIVSNDPVVDAGLDQTVILPNNTITISGSATSPDGSTIASYLWTQVEGPNAAVMANENTTTLGLSELILGEYVFRLTAINDSNDFGFDEVIVTVTDGAEAIRINSGGPNLTFNNIDWSADNYFEGGTVKNVPMPIANTSNDSLYQTERYHTSGTLVYKIPVANGTHNLNLHFAEIYFGVPGDGSDGGEGSRVFNIDIENGQGVRENYDIIKESGGPATAIIENFTGINVTDGELTITLTSVVENPKISGIEIVSGGTSSVPIADAGEDRTITIPVDTITLDGSASDPDGGLITSYLWTQESGPNTAIMNGDNTADIGLSGLIEGEYVFRLTVTDDDDEVGFDEVTVTVLGEPETFRINSGGPELSFNEEVWSEDNYFVGGSIFENIIDIANTENDAMYQTERFRSSNQPLVYEIPVTNGKHNVNLHFAEIYYGVASGGAAGGIGSRVFNINIENGQEQVDNYDIVIAAGGSATAVIESFTGIDVTDGKLSITLTPVTDTPKISGIEVIETRPPSASAGEDISLELPENSTTLNGRAVDPDGGEVTLLWTQVSGPNTATISGENSLELAISDLVEGEYIFRLTAIDDENETIFDEVAVSVYKEGELPTIGQMAIMLDENPTNDGVAKISVLNAPDDMEVLNIYLHDVGGRFIAHYDPNNPDIVQSDGTFHIDVSTLRDGLYFIGVGMNQGKPILIKLLVDN
ncbi:carbohydrate-binding protein [Kriegella sp. EG-1]|nr:carbohydrate-binding protein [Flavobacteriaceae bacterium EG-1]